MTIMFNKACALSKVHKNEDAMRILDQAIAIDKEYAKAYIKKGDILLQMEQYEASMQEYNKVKEFAPQTPGLREKVKHA
jgi:tetratricopeptide (TPR) repeat protein